MNETIPQTPDVITRYAALEPQFNKERRLKMMGLLKNIISHPSALLVIDLNTFLGSCVYNNTTREGVRQTNPVIIEIAQAIADAIPTDLKLKQIVKAQLVAAGQAIKYRREAFDDAGKDSGISVSDMDDLYNPAKDEIDNALEYF